MGIELGLPVSESSISFSKVYAPIDSEYKLRKRRTENWLPMRNGLSLPGLEPTVITTTPWSANVS